MVFHHHIHNLNIKTYLLWCQRWYLLWVPEWHCTIWHPCRSFSRWILRETTLIIQIYLHIVPVHSCIDSESHSQRIRLQNGSCTPILGTKSCPRYWALYMYVMFVCLCDYISLKLAYHAFYMDLRMYHTYLSRYWCVLHSVCIAWNNPKCWLSRDLFAVEDKNQVIETGNKNL